MFEKKVGPIFGCIVALLMVVASSSCATSEEILHQNVKDQNITKLGENLKQGMNINEKDGYGFTPLIVAAYYGYGPVVKFLCEQGADVNAKNNDGMSALLYAVENGYNDCFNILMDYRADVNLINRQGHNALWLANQYKRNDMIRKLEEAGAK
jgi:hypothetical protein